MKKRKRNKKQNGAAMPYPDIIINGRPVPVLRYLSNPLTMEACAEYGLDGVDDDMVHTDLNALHWQVVSPETSGLIYYLPDKTDLSRPIDVSTGLRLINRDPSITEVEALSFGRNGDYQSQPYKFSLPGELGCTAAANLGFFLLNALQGITTRYLGMLSLFDRDQLEETEVLNLPVADDSITKFCKDHDFEIIAVATQVSDCPKYRQCKNQTGQKCNKKRAKCR